MSPANRPRSRLPRGGRPRGAIVAIAAAALASSFATPASGTDLELAGPGTLHTYDARRGTTYNLGLTAWVRGPGSVEVLSARAVQASPGLEQPEALIGWGCDGNEYWGAVVASDATRLPRSGVTPLKGVHLAERDRSCRYVLLRFIPQRHGLLKASRGEVVYRVNSGPVRRATFDFATSFEVNGDGPDGREKKVPPQ